MLTKLVLPSSLKLGKIVPEQYWETTWCCLHGLGHQCYLVVEGSFELSLQWAVGYFSICSFSMSSSSTYVIRGQTWGKRQQGG